MCDRIRRMFIFSLLLAAAVQAMPCSAQQGTANAEMEEVDPRWLERLDEMDRALMDDLIGYAPPEFRGDLQWPNGEAKNWEELRGSVVVIQAWSSKSTKGRSAPLRAARALEDYLGTDDLHLIALHTPEGKENAAKFLERREIPAPVAVDPAGTFCDDLGVYQEPVNIIVDRNGVVRYAGLKIEALGRAAEKLTAEPFDPSAMAPERDASRSNAATEFPPFTGVVSSALDMRGKPSPDLVVDEWITDQPDVSGKVVIVDFWATWCRPCIQSIPHMNDLAKAFRDDVVCIGISDEQLNVFYDGMRGKKLTTSDFAYTLALDPRGRMKSELRVRGIPHCIVVSSDGVVRWQGHPAALREETVGQIVQANRTLLGHARPRRWGTKP